MGFRAKTVAKKKRNGAESLSDQAYNYLIDKLLSSQLVPGDLLNRRTIAAELGISVAPVLEAIVQLENDGFLESIPRKGTLVKSIRREDLRGQLIVREALECAAARLYCGAKIRQNLTHLNALADEVEQTRSLSTGWKFDYRFHHALVSMADCPALVAAFEKNMLQKVFMALNLYINAHPDPEHSEHHQLLQNLLAPDPNKAEAAIREHIRAGKSHILQP